MKQMREDTAFPDREQVLGSLFDDSPSHMAILDGEGRILEANAGWHRFAALVPGGCPDGGVGENYLDLVEKSGHPAGLEVAEAVRDLIAGRRKVFETEYQLSMPDGERRYATRIYRLGCTKQPRIVVERRDVTDLRRAHRAVEALEERERTYESFIEHASDGMVITDPDGRILSTNPRAREILGHTPEGLHGRNVLDIIDADNLKAVPLRLDALARGEAVLVERVVRRADGSRRHIETSARMIDGRILSVIRDIQVRKEEAEARRAAEIALQESEERLRALVEHSSDMTVVLDARGRITFSDRSREEMLGRSAAENAIGAPIDLGKVHPDDSARARRLWGEVFGTPGHTVETELRAEHGDGSWRTLHVRATNLLENPAVEGVVVNVQDITEQALLEQELEQAQKMEAIGRLAGGVAHDFNNLLTGIRGYAQLSIDELEADHPVRANLDEVVTAADRAASLTRQLLAFSRRQIMQPCVVDLNERVRNLERMLERVIGEDIDIVSDLDPDAGCLRIDPGQLEQVIMNLALNARDAMPRGGRVTIRTRRTRLGPEALAATDGADLEPGDYLEVEVSDTGVGMDEATLERVFEPFYTTKELGKGTGLGLSTVYGIIKQSGGLIRVSSEAGTGSRFRVLFPRVVGEPSPSRSTAPGEPEEGTETILLVEDDGPVRRLARRVLERQGYAVIEAENGLEAVDRYRERGPSIDMVLSDVVMPGMGGRELVERIHELEPGVPILLMSGYTDDVILRHGAQDLGNGFLEKPFTANGLAAAVRQTLTSRTSGPGSARRASP